MGCRWQGGWGWRVKVNKKNGIYGKKVKGKDVEGNNRFVAKQVLGANPQQTKAMKLRSEQ